MHNQTAIQTKHLAYMENEGFGIDRALQMVGLPDIDEKAVSKFSLGMRQRLGIARALIHQPEILILDEPINGLDPMGIKEVRELFVRLAKEHGMTILLSSHILSEIEHIADKVGAISILLFGVLSAAMYVKLIIEEYSGKRLALWIGFIKKSVSVTLISAFILSGLYGNIATGSAGNMAVSLLISGISLIAILVVFVTLSHKINHMEVE